MSKSIGFQLRNEALDKKGLPSISIDEKYGVYRSIEDACASIPLTQRNVGLTIGIEIAQGVVKEYWWQETITDEGLVKKVDNDDIDSIIDEIDIINQRLDLLKNIQFKVVEELPLVGEENIRYLVSNGTVSEDNKYDEYFWLVGEQRYEKYGGINASGSIVINNNYDFNNDHFSKSTLNNIITVNLKNPLGSLIFSSGNSITFANNYTGVIESVSGADFYIGKSNKTQGIVFNDNYVNLKGSVKINNLSPILSGSNGLSTSGQYVYINSSGSINFGGKMALFGTVELNTTNVYGSTIGDITRSGNITVLCGNNGVYITTGGINCNFNYNGSLSLYGTYAYINGNYYTDIGGGSYISIHSPNIVDINGSIIRLSGSAIESIVNNISLSGNYINLTGTNNINLNGSCINLNGNVNIGDMTGSLALIKKDNANINIKCGDSAGSINLLGSNINITPNGNNNSINIGGHLITGKKAGIYLGFSGGGTGSVFIIDGSLTYKFIDGSFVLQ